MFGNLLLGNCSFLRRDGKEVGMKGGQVERNQEEQKNRVPAVLAAGGVYFPAPTFETSQQPSTPQL